MVSTNVRSSSSLRLGSFVAPVGALLIGLALSASVAFAEKLAVESRGNASWPTRNHFRVVLREQAPAGLPMAAEFDTTDRFNPDSVRVLAEGNTKALPSKTERRWPHAKVSFLSTGASHYAIYFDEGGSGETERSPEPAMIGTGDRVTFGRPGVRGRVAVGLWPHPAALDFDGDGKIDLIIGCADRPSNGTYLFRNIGSNQNPLYARGEWMGAGTKEMVAADFNGDGAVDLVINGGYYSDVRKNRLSKFVKVELPRSYHIGRDDMWQPVDWDGDGRIDVLAGVSDWRDYGWDDAFDGQGRWTRGPLHGYVYLHRNVGTNAEPRYEPPVKIEAAGKPVDQYGSPAPTAVDWFGSGRLDLIAGSFIDTISLFRNIGSRTEPRLAAGELLKAGGSAIHMDLCMIQPRVVQWHADGRPSLLVSEEDGTVTLFENSSPKGKEPVLRAGVPLEQADPYVKSGALSRPVAFDWNGDGKLDLIAGNSAGYLQYFENVGTKEQPAFEDRGYLRAGGRVIRNTAGANLSIQGPAEEKWGYSNPSVGDWDGDGLPDILVNDIVGAVVWYRNVGTRTHPELAVAQPVEVEWTGPAPKPEWVWWEPKGKQLVTQWRTTPKVIDWDGDGLQDLVMMNHQGYLCLFRRQKTAKGLVLLPPERLFLLSGGRFLNLSAGRAGASGRRKVDFYDLDGDGDMDLITDSNDGPLWYENIGSQARPILEPRGLLTSAKLPGHNPTPNVADWNHDGVADILVGAEDGFFYYFDGKYNAAHRAGR